MRLIFTKLGGKADRLDIVRDDGSADSAWQPKQRIIPHDMVHAVVEHSLGQGFLTMVSRGAAAGFAAGTAATTAEPVERVVEVLQADGWDPAPAPSDAALLAAYVDACRARGHEAKTVTAAMVASMRSRMRALQADWDALAIGGTLTLAHDRHA